MDKHINNITPIKDDEGVIYAHDVNIDYDTLDQEHDINELIIDEIDKLEEKMKCLQIIKDLLEAKRSNNTEYEIVKSFYAKNLLGIAEYIINNCEYYEQNKNNAWDLQCKMYYIYKNREVYTGYSCNHNNDLCNNCTILLETIKKYKLSKCYHLIYHTDDV